MERWLVGVGAAVLLAFLPMVAVLLVSPPGSLSQTAALVWFGLTFWPGPLVAAGLYLAVRGLRRHELR